MVLAANVSLGLAAFQGAMVLRNLPLLHAPPQTAGPAPPLSVLIPARDEEQNLPRLLGALREQQGLEFEVIVLDDGSRDATLSLALQAAQCDSRFRAVAAPPLPEGWAGKQHACHLLSTYAVHSHWLFLDADVVLTDPLALARISVHLENNAAAMQSGIPRQITEGWAEQMIVPLIHLVLLGYLPFWEMRRNPMPALGAACGQMLAVKAEPYRQVGGHAAVRHRLHDATALASLFRTNGYLSDLFDATPLADCRMYRQATDVFSGFSKNATEGMAQPHTLPLWSALLLGANLLPWVLIATGQASWPAWLAALIDLAVYWSLKRKYRHTVLGALSRPLGVSALIAIQWAALGAKWLGLRASWKGRSYRPGHG